MQHDQLPRPAFGQPGWRRRMEMEYGWDKEFAAIGFILLLVLISFGFARADDDHAAPVSDPKDMSAPAEIPRCYTDAYFLPLPAWSHFTKMPSMPDALTPMGAVANKAKPSPAAVAETKPDAPPMPKKLPQVYPLASSSTPAPAAKDLPTLVAISPFLQWIKDHPQEAAAQAHKEADAYNTSAHAAPSEDPYWMPPMIESDSTLQSGNGSSASYSTPQK